MTTALSSTRPASLRSLFYPFFFSRQMERGTGTSLITRNQHLGLLNKQHYSLPLSNNSVSLYIYKEKHFKCVFKKMLMKYPQRVRISSVSPVRRLGIYIYTVFAYIHIYIYVLLYISSGLYALFVLLVVPGEWGGRVSAVPCCLFVFLSLYLILGWTCDLLSIGHGCGLNVLPTASALNFL